LRLHVIEQEACRECGIYIQSGVKARIASSRFGVSTCIQAIFYLLAELRIDSKVAEWAGLDVYIDIEVMRTIVVRPARVMRTIGAT
jgi:hypothetical protein